jgi:hypothetical protein
MAITNNDLRFQLDLYKNDKDFKLTDTTDYATGSVDYASGLYKVVSPVGTTVYENSGYATDDFSSPDVAYHLSDTNVDDLALPTTVSGDIVTGIYTIYNKTIVWDLKSTTSAYSTTLTAATKTIAIDGISSADAALVLASGFLEFAVSGDKYTIVSGSFAGTVLTVVVEESVTDGTASYTFNIYEEDSSYATSKEFKYSYTSPVVSIDYSLSCSESKLISTDSTDYSTTNCTDEISPSTTTRTHSVTAPTGSGYGSIADSSDAERTFLNIWTNVWQTSISTVLEYEIEDWDSVNWYSIHDLVTGYDSIDVVCDSCECDMLACMEALYVKWLNAIQNNPRTEADLRKSIIKVNNLFVQFKMAQACGEDTSSYCEAIKDILSYNDCTCSSSTDDSSVLVVATTASSVSIPLFGTTAPSDGIGNNGQVYYNTTTWDVYSKEDGSWVLQGNIKGATGATGAIGESTTQITVVPVSFEDDETGTISIPFTFGASISSVVGYVTRTMAGTDDGTVDLEVDSSSKGTLTFANGRAVGYVASGTISEFSISNGQSLDIIMDKTTKGGRGHIVITYTQS